MNGAIAFALNDSIKKNDSVIKNDSSHIDIKVPPSAELQKMLSDEDYIYDRVGPAPKTPWERFKEWFWRMVDDLFDSNGGKIGLGILKYLLIVAAIVLIIFLLIKNDIRALFYGKSASIAIDFKEFEEDIHSINFQELIAKAIQNKDYRKAIRLHFLKLLKELTDKNLIKWQIDKTNNDYTIELAKSKYSNQFNELALLYEYIWYGDFELNEESFKSTVSKFNAFKA
jgi:hypothetical protein